MIYTRIDNKNYVAFALTEEAWNNPSTCPKWLADFISDGNVFIAKNTLVMKIRPGLPGTCRTLEFGDMVHMDMTDGYINTCTVEEFNSTYEPVVNPEYFAILRVLNDARKEYISFLGKAINDTAAFLAAHGQGATKETQEEGVRLRNIINELESKLYD